MTRDDILKNKTVSIWGFGYLGYFAILKVQELGFRTRVFDFESRRFDAFLKGDYPGPRQRMDWSRHHSIPDLNPDLLELYKEPEGLFETSAVHVISFPIRDKGKAKGLNLEKLAQLFIKHVKGEPLILFQSVGIPGQIEEQFCKPLQQADISCSVGVAFRSDWMWEEYQAQSSLQMIAGNNPQALEHTSMFLDLLKVSHQYLGSIKEAEVYENSRNAIAYTTTALINQLSLGYPDIDFQKIANGLAKDAPVNGFNLKIGAGGYRMPFSVDALMAGSEFPETMSILKEAEAVNFSTVLSYSEYLARHGYRSVMIWGVTNLENQKDLIAISPSLAMAENLNSRGLTVYLNDPQFSSEELKTLMPFCTPAKLEALPADVDALIVMSPHIQYKCLAQECLDEWLHPNIKLIVDNTGIFSYYRFQHAQYHQVGDGRIQILK